MVVSLQTILIFDRRDKNSQFIEFLHQISYISPPDKDKTFNERIYSFTQVGINNSIQKFLIVLQDVCFCSRPCDEDEHIYAK